MDRARRTTLLVAASVCLLFAPARPAGATLLLDVADQGASAVVDASTPFTVRILAQGIPSGSDGAGMFGFGFEIGFADGAFAAATPVAEAVWTGQQATSVSATSTGIIANRFGEACGPFGTNCSLGSGMVLLATVVLTPLSTGSFDLSLSHFTAPGDTVLFDLTVLDGDASFFEGASVQIVPEPVVASLLLASALALRRRI